MDSSSRCVLESQQEVTSPPRAPPREVAVGDGVPELQVEEPPSTAEAPPLPPSTAEAPPLPPPAETSEEEEEEEDIFPGTHFLSVADVVQLQRDGLEQRLVEWVEQQLMSRMISEMYRPPLTDPAYNLPTDQSECEEQSFTSDTGLQLCVVTGVPVDSVLVRQLVTEDSGPPLVLTPAPTPPLSPAPSSRETPPLATPPPSEPTSILSPESPQPIIAPEPVATPPSSPEHAPSAGCPEAPTPPACEDAELQLDEERAEETHPHLESEAAGEEPPLSPPPLPTCSSSPTCSSAPSSCSSVTEAALRHISEGELLLSPNNRTGNSSPLPEERPLPDRETPLPEERHLYLTERHLYLTAHLYLKRDTFT
ncbi:hypothetical protein JOQ06_029610 [Pogonophryne albipinna]|uniref:Uncharacterized protein n=1 Tax=Pogonophryne albipinna TaxID=1090488 RepID=A0AAD6A538_9TELE|nr:hypothetical protein JOQ06_029610 [Pogonophryne albipinna]